MKFAFTILKTIKPFERTNDKCIFIYTYTMTDKHSFSQRVISPFTFFSPNIIFRNGIMYFYVFVGTLFTSVSIFFTFLNSSQVNKCIAATWIMGLLEKLFEHISIKGKGSNTDIQCQQFVWI